MSSSFEDFHFVSVNWCRSDTENGYVGIFIGPVYIPPELRL